LIRWNVRTRAKHRGTGVIKNFQSESPCKPCLAQKSIRISQNK
jgi:hypothetical protein